jgi:hypothetical protein
MLTLEPITPRDLGKIDASADALHLHFTLLTRNKLSKPTIPSDGANSIHAFWSGESGTPEGFEVATHGLAQYRISCVAPKTGAQHLLHVRVNGLDVRDSPMLVTVPTEPATFSWEGPGVTAFFQTDLESPAVFVLKAENPTAQESIEGFWAGNTDLLEVTATFNPATSSGSRATTTTPQANKTLAVWACMPTEAIRQSLEEWNSITKRADHTNRKVALNPYKHKELQAPDAMNKVPILARRASMFTWANPIIPNGNTKNEASHFSLLMTSSEHTDIKRLADCEVKDVDFGSNDPFQDKRFDEEARSSLPCANSESPSLTSHTN